MALLTTLLLKCLWDLLRCQALVQIKRTWISLFYFSWGLFVAPTEINCGCSCNLHELLVKDTFPPLCVQQKILWKRVKFGLSVVLYYFNKCGLQCNSLFAITLESNGKFISSDTFIGQRHCPGCSRIRETLHIIVIASLGLASYKVYKLSSSVRHYQTLKCIVFVSTCR